MPKRIISLILLIGYFFVCPALYVADGSMTFIRFIIWIVPSILMVIELSAIINYYFDTNHNKVAISFKVLKTYMDLNPKRYCMQSIERCVYYKNTWDQPIHTVIYMDSIWSSFLYFIYFFKLKRSKKEDIKRKDMIRYLNAVQEDIDAMKEKVDET